MQIHTQMQRQADRLSASARQLRLLSHESVLERGFALVLNEAGRPIRRADDAPHGSLLNVQLADAQSLLARVEGPESEAISVGEKGQGRTISPAPAAKKSTKKARPQAKPSPADDGQGNLL